MKTHKPQSIEEVCASIQLHLERHLAQSQPDFNEALHQDMSFDYMGLDSVSRVELVSLLARDWSVTLPPTAAYDFVTIGALGEFIWSELASESPSPATS